MSYKYYGCSSLTSITIPEGVTSIGSAAFSGCSSLTSITIPEGLTSIESYAFSFCRNLKTIYCYAEDTPIVGTSPFYNVNVRDVMLVVPDNAEDKYRVHEYWGQFWIETPTGIKSTEEERSMTEDAAIFNLSGQRSPVLQKGINIIRYSGGTSKKLMVK